MNGGNDSSPVRGMPVDDVTGGRQNEPCSSQSEPPRNRPARRGGRRGPTRLKELSIARTVGQKLDIQFNEHLTPCGPNKSKYTSYVGLLARSKPSILTDEWKNVDKEKVKDLIWASIRLTYNVPDDEKLKEKTLSYCAERWRKFKTQLANNYIFAEVPDGEPRPDPCAKYAFLDEETWQQFVRMRTTEEALRRRQQAQEIGRKNDCPHTASRGGYEKAEKELMAAKRKRLEAEAESNPSAICDPPSPVRREELWLYIRQKKGGAYSSEQTRVVAERIEDLKMKEAEGSFVSDGRKDILTVATGKPDHAGRVRGIGGRVGLKEYFGKSNRQKQSMVTREEMERTLAKATEEAEARAEAKAAEREASLSAMFQDQLKKMKEEMMMIVSSRGESTVPLPHSPAPVQQSTKGSCIVGQPGEPCDIYVEDPDRRLVARGNVYNLGSSTVHHRQMADDEVRVSVEEVIIDAPIPLQTDEFKVVSDCLGNFIPWPVKLVHVSTPPQAPAPADQAAAPRDILPTPKLKAKDEIGLLVVNQSFGVREWPVNEVVGLRDMLPVYVDQEDLISLLFPKKELTNAIVFLLIKLMHREMGKQGRDHDFGFLCPDYISVASLKERQAYISRRLCGSSRRWYLGPFNHANHWQLVLLCAEENKVVFLCSLHNEPLPTVKQMVDKPMLEYQKKVKRKAGHQVKDPTWIIPKTRRQPVGSNLCGFYVMRHIYDIITQSILTITAETFACADPFPDGDIERIREVICEYISETVTRK